MIDLDLLGLTIPTLILNDHTEIYQNQTTLSLNLFTKLTVFSSGQYSFRSIQVLRLENMPELVNVTIGNGSFTRSLLGAQFSSDHELVINSCQKVQRIIIGSGAFADYTGMTISNLPSLKYLEIGGDPVDQTSRNFYHSSRFWLSSMLLLSMMIVNDD